MSLPAIKCVIVGDGAVGKTCLLMTKVFDNYTAPVEIGKTKYQLSLIDTAGQEDYESLRKCVYPGTSVFILCFSVVLRSSFCNIAHKWIRDVRGICPTTPILLVGCQTDARSDAKVTTITYSEGKKLAKEIGAVKYVECSALMNDGVDDVFNKAILIGAGLVNKKRSRCFIM